MSSVSVLGEPLTSWTYLKVKARIELGSSSRTRIGLSAKMCSLACLWRITSQYVPEGVEKEGRTEDTRGE
jgi:hypothetical protein